MPRQYCPSCGTKLICIATASFFVGEDETLLKEQMEKSEKWKKVWQETVKGHFSRMDVEFLVCGKCKRLLLGYGNRGYYFDILGSLTDEAVALLVAGKLKEEEK